MKFKPKLYLALISLLVSLVLCSNIQVNSDFSQKSPVNNLESSTLQAPIFIDGKATGVGAHNWTWAESQPWCTGSGTVNEPYIIENLIINAGGTYYGIEIDNSNVYIVIRHCTISNASTGIEFYFVNNALIIDNNCSNNWNDGIYLQDGNNNKIIHNIANYGDEGIDLWDCNNTVIYQNTAN